MSRLFVETVKGGLKLKWRNAAWEGVRPLWLMVLAVPWVLPESISLLGWLLVCAVAYVEVAHILNGTNVLVTSEGLSFKPGPLPWPGQTVLLRKEVKALTFRVSPSSRRGFFQVEVLAADNQKHVVLRRLPSSAMAQKVTELLHEHLSRPVQVE